MIIADVHGNCGSDPEIKTSKNGGTFMTFSVASSTGGNSTWVRCVCFESKLIDYMREKIRKGTRVQVSGKLAVTVSDKYTNVDLVVDRLVSAYNKGEAVGNSNTSAKSKPDSGTTDLEDAPF